MGIASLMQSPLWATAGWVMVHFLWAGAAIGLIAAVGRRFLPNNPEKRYAFALGCLGAAIVTPGVIVLCLHRGGMTAPVLSGPLPAVAAAEADAAPPAHWLESTEAAPSAFQDSTLATAVLILPWLWLIGAPCTFLMVMTGLIGSERLRQQSLRLDRGDFADTCRRLAEALEVRRDVALGLCTRLASPILVGILRPMILLPPAAMSGWSVEQLEMVLLHELAHVRRWDNLVNLLQRIAEATLFFHPVVWWLSAWIRLEREMCCDHIVVGHTGKPQAYAETLAALVVTEPIIRTGALAMVENALVIRIRRILNLEDRSMKMPIKMFSFGAALPVAALVAIGLYAQNDAPKRGPSDDKTKALVVDEKGSEARKNSDPSDKSAIRPPDGGLIGRLVADMDLPQDDAKKTPNLSQRALVEASQQVQLRSRASRVVKAVAVDLGSRVQQGQLLVQLEAPEAEFELRLKTALVQQAKAEANRAKSTVRAAQAALQSTRAQIQEVEVSVNGAKANLEFRRREYDRQDRLFRTSGIDEKERNQAYERFQAAKATQDAVEAKLQATKPLVEESMAKVDHAQAGVQVAEANLVVADVGLQRAQALLQSSQILAPFDGVITSRNVDVGTFIQVAGLGNGAPLMTVARTDVVRIVVQVPEADIAKFGANATASIEIDALPRKKFEGKVSRVAPALDPATRTLRAEIDLRNDGTILPGFSGTVTLKKGQ